MSTRPIQRSRLIAALLLLLTGCGSSSDENQDTAQDGGSAGSAGSTPAGSGDQAGSGSLASGDGPSWSNDVHAALVGGCGNCHGMSSGGASGPPRPGLPGVEGGGTNAPGKFALEDAHDAYVATMTLVVAGDPAKSSLYIKISEDMPSNGGQRMPPALRQWDDASIALVHDWIAAGAHEN